MNYKTSLLFLLAITTICAVMYITSEVVVAYDDYIDEKLIIGEIVANERQSTLEAAQSTIEKEQQLAQLDATLQEFNIAPTYYGVASWYALDGNYTASGEIMDSSQMTAASMQYPLGSVVRVTNTATGAYVDVRINDTGGFEPLGRIIDLSRGAFEAIGSTGSGLINVSVTQR